VIDRSATPPTDDELVTLANEGDDTAFEAIYYRYRDWALRVARRFVRDSNDIGDVVQEAFAYLFDKFPGFELTGTLKGLLYPTIKNLSISRARRSHPTVPLDDMPESLLVDTGSTDSEKIALVGSLRRLSALHQEILLLRFADDLSLPEIAAALGIPLGTVKSRLHNALEALRAHHGKD